MRVTENRLMELAASGLTKARDAAATAQEVMSSGLAVERPSQGVAAWAEGQRTAARTLMSGARGGGIESAINDLQATDGALATIGTALQSASTLAQQMANGTMSATDRQNAATTVQSLMATAIAAANSQGPSGGYLLAGASTTTPPFDQTGAYQGDASTLTIQTSETSTGAASVSGSALTASSGVDVFAVLSLLAASLQANESVGVSNAITQLNQAVAQVANARALTGARTDALEDADTARKSFETNLAAVHTQAVAADPIAAASNLQQASAALQSAQAAAAQIISLTTSLLPGGASGTA